MRLLTLYKFRQFTTFEDMILIFYITGSFDNLELNYRQYFV